MTSPIPGGDLAVQGLKTVFGSAKKVVEGVVPGADAANAALDGVVAVRRWAADRHNWVRVGWFVAGMTLMYIGAFMLVRPTVESAVKTAASVAPVGKMAKAVT